MNQLSKNCTDPGHVRKKRRMTRKAAQAYSMAVIPLLFVLVFSYLPMFGIIIAFKDYKYNLGIFHSPWVGLRNFEFFFKSNDFTRITFNTLYLNAIFIVVGTIAAVALALLLFGLTSRTGKKVYQTILISPYFLSWVVVGYMVYGILNPSYGLLNSVIKQLGMTPVDVYSKPDVWPLILTVASVWKNVGMDSVIYLAALMGLDVGLFEAAATDGASRSQIRRHIIIPELTSIISIMTILKIGSIFRSDFGLFYQLTRDIGTLYRTTDVVDTYVFRSMRVLGDMGMSSAVGLVQSVVGFVLVMATNYITKKIEPDNALF